MYLLDGKLPFVNQTKPMLGYISSGKLFNMLVCVYFTLYYHKANPTFILLCSTVDHCLEFLAGPWFQKNGPGEDYVDGECSYTLDVEIVV